MASIRLYIQVDINEDFVKRLATQLIVVSKQLVQAIEFVLLEGPR